MSGRIEISIKNNYHPYMVQGQCGQIGRFLDFGQVFLAFGIGNFCKGVKIYHFSSEIMFGQALQTFGDFFWSHCTGVICLNGSPCVCGYFVHDMHFHNQKMHFYLIYCSQR